MSESSAADAAALRREARRRRILENSESRLRSITGKESSSQWEAKEPRRESCFSIRHEEIDSSDSIDPLGDAFSGSRPFGNVNADFSSFPGTFDYNFDKPQAKARSDVERSFLERLVRKRFHFIILSVVVRFLLLSKLGFLFYNNVFCPFITVKLMELILIQDTVATSKSNILSLMVSLSKKSALVYVCRALSAMKRMISDLLLYMFTFVLSDKLLDAVEKSYLT